MCPVRSMGWSNHTGAIHTSTLATRGRRNPRQAISVAMVSAGPMDNGKLKLLKGVQPSSHHPLSIFKPVKPDKRLVVCPNNESSAAQVRTKLYTHGNGRQHLSFGGAVSTLRRPESTTAVSNDPFLVILDLAKYSTQAKITSICIQYVVPGLSRKSQNGGSDERISQAVAHSGRHTKGTSLPVSATRGSAMSAKQGINRR